MSSTTGHRAPERESTTRLLTLSDVMTRQGHAIWEFKRHQIRFLGRFGPGRQFLVAHGLKKKQDKHRPADLDRTARILTEYLARHEQEG